MLVSRNTIGTTLLVLLTSFPSGGCAGPGSGNSTSMGGRTVQVVLETAEEHPPATPTSAVETSSDTALVEASAKPPKSATVYLVSEFAWGQLDGVNQVTAIRTAQSEGRAADARALRDGLLAGLRPTEVDPARTPLTTKLQPQPHVYVAVRGEELAYGTFDALDVDQRHIDIRFD